MNKIERKAKVGSVLEHQFIEGKFYRANIDNTYRKIALKIYGFEAFPKGRIVDLDKNVMDFEVFLSSLKVLNCGDNIVGPNGETIPRMEDNEDKELPFRLIPTTKEHTNYIHSGGTLLLEVDLTVPSKEDTIDGYTGVTEVNFHDDSFMVTYETYKREPEPKNIIEGLKIDVMDFIEHVDNANSGHDRDTVFAYLEDYLKEEHNTTVDIYGILGIDD